MALFKTLRGSRQNLDNIEKTDGYAYFCPDDGSFHIDYLNNQTNNIERIQLNANCANKLVDADGNEYLPEDFLQQEGVTNLVFEVTWKDLLVLKQNKQLIPGAYYRIIDYFFTTFDGSAQTIPEAAFDIIIQATSNYSLSENAKADYREWDFNYFRTITQQEGLFLKEGSVQVYGFEFLDDGSFTDSDYKSADAFIEYEYLENMNGVTVPVIYKNDLSMAGDPEYAEADYGDAFYYVETIELNGQACDKWEKFENGEYPSREGEETQIFLYTNPIVENNTILEEFTMTEKEEIIPIAHLGAWELKYCLENDTNRFDWADPSGGTGIIYWMKDEWGNECGYDFKSVRFYNEELDSWTPTFYDMNNPSQDASLSGHIKNNKIDSSMVGSRGAYQLPFVTIGTSDWSITNVHVHCNSHHLNLRGDGLYNIDIYPEICYKNMELQNNTSYRRSGYTEVILDD